ncbi:MAG: ABC transporter substrate-binding protein [Pseudomonadota bacterium]
MIGGLLALAGALSAQAEGAPQRIVIAGGDLTEIVFALGEGERVVAVDSTSSYPPETETLPKIGYMRRLAPEGVLTTAPDLLLAGAGAGPDSAMDRLRQAGVDVRIGPDDPSLDGVAAKIRFVGDALDRRDEAEALIDRVSGQLAAAIAAAGESEASPRVLFLMTAGRNGVLAAGADTSAQAIIELAGGENAVTGFNGYKPLSAEVALASAPDVLLMPTHAAEAMGGAETALARPELAATPAGRAKRVVVIDGLLLLGFGPRTPEAVSTLAAALHGAE